MGKEVIAKRKNINSDIIAELDAKYPLVNEKNGIAYSRDLKYITFESSNFDANIIGFDINIGFGVFNVILYFSEQMMKNGYKVRVDGYNMQRHLNICSAEYGVPVNKSAQIVDFLISQNYFFKISDGIYEYLTTAQAVFDYERCMHSRAEERKRKAKSREKYKQMEAAKNNSQPLLPAPMQSSNEYQYYEEGYNPYIGDNTPVCPPTEEEYIAYCNQRSYEEELENNNYNYDSFSSDICF